MLRSAVELCDEIMRLWVPTVDGLRLLISNQYFSPDSKLENILIISVCGEKTNRKKIPLYYFSIWFSISRFDWKHDPCSQVSFQ